MFTGLIEQLGRVARLEPVPAGLRLAVDPAGWNHRPAPGESIALNGCCLTVAAPPEGAARLLLFDAVPETLGKTTLGRLREGSRVNLEHAATPATLLGGHIVQGHVDGVGVFEKFERGAEVRVRVRPPADLMPFITPKGSVAIDGISLTIAAVSPADGWFEVALIPTTLAKTTLGEARQEDACNIECDALVKAAVHWLRHYAGR